MYNNLLVNLFSEYYRKMFKVEDIWELEKREFAFQPFKEDKMYRHLAFKSSEQLKQYIIKNTPRHAFYSTAIYEIPEAPSMDDKGWIGAELVFDIDADHIETPCKHDHDYWECLDCKISERGTPPSECPRCGSSRITTFTWVCERCIEAAKQHAIRLIEDFLVGDLGFNPKTITIYFTGHRGFHIHVIDDKILTLSSDERRELVDYIKGLGLDLKLLKPSGKGLKVPILSLEDPGWRGRIAKALYDYLSKVKFNQLLSILGDVQAVENIISERLKILDLLSGDYKSVEEAVNIIGFKNYMRILRNVSKSLGVDIDEKVTIDVKRLIRLPNSLHGKTGLPVRKVEYIKLEDFKLSIDLSPFKGGYGIVRLKSEIPRNLTLFNDLIKGSVGEKLKIVLPAAVYLSAKGLAELEDVM